MKDGVLFINKPNGVTSRDVVNKISKIYQTKKVGHTGTLDPIATGVLIICLGKYTKLVEELTSADKEYIATMRLGIQTDTKDITGKIIKEKKVTAKKDQIIESFNNFPLEYDQVVPIYSAVKINGKKLYEYARNNEEIKLPTRKVFLKNLEIISFNKNEITFKVTVSKGTYIRSLIEDLAASFNELATMKELIRTKQGNYELKDCEELENININTPLKQLENLFNYKIINIDEKLLKKVSNGNKLFLSCNEPKVFLKYNNNVIAIYEKNEDYYKMIFKVI